MIEEYEKQKRKRLALRKSIMDYAIGVLITGMGVFFLSRQNFKLQFNEDYPPNNMDKVFGVICLLYGGWRIYRGYKKNYFR
jgi:threonine/homoserine/homoserine lactone efflux protein